MGSDSDGRVAKELMEMMRWANRMDVRREVWVLEGTKLSPTELGLLVALEEHGPVRLTDLAAGQGVDRSTLSPQVRRLEKLELVARTTDPHDARSTPLELTATGLAAVAELRASATALITERLTGWTAAERTEAAVILERLVASLENEDPGPTPSAA